MASERCRHVVQVAAFGCAAAELEQELIDRPDSGFEHADAGGSPSARAAKACGENTAARFLCDLHSHRAEDQGRWSHDPNPHAIADMTANMRRISVRRQDLWTRGPNLTKVPIPRTLVSAAGSALPFATLS